MNPMMAKRKRVTKTASARRPRGPVRFAVAIMAAGKGTRIKSRHPKVLHAIGGKPLLEHVIAAATHVVPPADVYCIVGHEAERVIAAMQHTGVHFVLQPEQRGTGDAIRRCREVLAGYDHVLVLSGDVPLIRPGTIAQLRDVHLQRGADMTALTMTPHDPAQYGRIVRKPRRGPESDEIAAIVELKALSPEHRHIREVNSGVYAFAVPPLFAHIDRLTTRNPAGEYYLTDMAGLLGGPRARCWRCPSRMRPRSWG